jgi:hypothetical protein
MRFQATAHDQAQGPPQPRRTPPKGPEHAVVARREQYLYKS